MDLTISLPQSASTYFQAMSKEELKKLIQTYIEQERLESSILTMDQENYAYFKSYSQTPLPKNTEQLQKPILNAAPLAVAPIKQSIPKPAEPPKTENIKVQLEDEKPVVPPHKLVPPIDKNEFSHLMKTHFPEYSLRDEAPAKTLSDKPAPIKQIPAVIILSFYDDAPSQSFLKSVSEAIKSRLATSCAVYSAYRIEQEKKWEPLLNSSEIKLILAPLHKMKELPGLMVHYEERPGEPVNRLNDKPLIPLFDPSQYLKDPKRKAFLWESICKQL